MHEWLISVASWGLAHLEGLIAALGLIFVGWQVHLQTRAEKEALTHAYLSRYWEIDDALRTPRLKAYELAFHTARYLRLTQDEFEAARLGWLPAGRWKVWHEWLCSERFRDELERRFEATGAPADEFQYLRKCLEHRSGHSWTTCPSFSKPTGFGRRASRTPTT